MPLVIYGFGYMFYPVQDQLILMKELINIILKVLLRMKLKPVWDMKVI
jgi:hypothetical protein